MKTDEKSQKKQLSPAARRALQEAEERRKSNETAIGAGKVAYNSEKPHEIGGRDGPDPVRFGDWEKGGIASDF